MSEPTQQRSNNVVFLGILVLSALSMIWLFWHHPLKTAVATVVILAIFWVSTRLARSIEAETEESELN